MGKEQAIGFFDSGLGGISVLAAAVKELPHERYYYLGDSANAPYGTKSDAEVLRLTTAGVERLIDQGIKALVIACNTASGIAAESLRQKYHFPIIALEPALKVAAQARESGVILVLATPLALNSRKYQNLYDQYGEHSVSLPCPGLMDFVEREELDSPALDRYLDGLFSPFIGQDIDSAVLGCTHYLFLRDAITRHLPRKTKIIDSNQGVVRQLKNKLIIDGLLVDAHESGEVTFLSTGGPEKILQMERMLQRAQKI